MKKIDFKINDFCDALHLADDHEMTDAQIEAMKQARYEKWYKYITNPPVAVDTPVEE
jgi:hypothetical protein